MDAESRPRPEDVFTPASPVRREMFATRRAEDLQDRVEAALSERGKQVVLYGPTGVGKTSLINYLSSERDLPLVRVECGEPFEDMMREALASVVGVEEVSIKDLTASNTEIGASLWAFVRGQRGVEESQERISQAYHVSLNKLVVESLYLKGIRILFIDNFENLDDREHYRGTARDVVQLMKSFADRSDDYGSKCPKVVVAGIPDASDRLLDIDRATERRVDQIEVSKMPDKELDEILAKGERELGMSFEGFCRERIIAYSDGFPYYTHLFGLHTSRRAIEEGRREVSLEDFSASMESILSSCTLSLRRSYERAVETTGSVKVRRSILEALADLNQPSAPFRDIRAQFLRAHPQYKDSQLNFLSPAIKQLKEDLGILKDRDMPKSPYNEYSFRDPLMRAYVKLRRLNQSSGQLRVNKVLPAATSIHDDPES